jgi:pimeloyl-ACP methyl ester carboxylesterase
VPTEIPARTKWSVKADDGHTLAVWSRIPAAPKGAIVLVHGRTWSGVPDFDLEVEGKDRSLMRALAERGWAAYALDLRGYGATERDASGWNTPDRAAKDLAAALAFVRAQHPDLPAPAVLGWSLGSLVAQLAAQRDASSMSALVLYGYPRDPDRVGKGGGAVGDEPARSPNTAAAAASDFITPGSIDRASIDAFVAAALAADPVRADWRKMGDPFAPVASQGKLFARLGHADRQWVIVEGGDHAAHLEDCGARFVQAVVAFLDRPPTTPASAGRSGRSG